jgi:hypothetical protein
VPPIYDDLHKVSEQLYGRFVAFPQSRFMPARHEEAAFNPLRRSPYHHVVNGRAGLLLQANSVRSELVSQAFDRLR